jgi:hypothetical protein
MHGEEWRALIAAHSAASVSAGRRSGDPRYHPPFVATTHRDPHQLGHLVGELVGFVLAAPKPNEVAREL